MSPTGAPVNQPRKCLPAGKWPHQYAPTTEDEEGDMEDRSQALLSSSLSSAGSWFESDDENCKTRSTKPGKSLASLSSSIKSLDKQNAGKTLLAMPQSGKSLASIAAMANAKSAGHSSDDSDSDDQSDTTISLAQSICGICSKSTEQSSWTIECEACQGIFHGGCLPGTTKASLSTGYRCAICMRPNSGGKSMAAIMAAATAISRKPSTATASNGRGQQRKKTAGNVATSNNARRKTATPRSNTKSKRKTNRKTKAAPLPEPVPLPPVTTIATVSNGLSNGMDEDEDEDICPVCDTDCTCKPATTSVVEQETPATIPVTSARPAGKAIPWSIKSTLSKSNGHYDSSDTNEEDEDDEDEEVVYQRLVDRLNVLEKGRPIPNANQKPTSKKNDNNDDDVLASNSFSSLYSSSLTSFHDDDDDIRLSDTDTSSQDDGDDDDDDERDDTSSEDEEDEEDNNDNVEEAIANITLEMDDLDQITEEAIWSPSTDQDIGTILDMCLDGGNYNNSNSSAVSTPTPLTDLDLDDDLDDDDEINDSDVAMEEERYLVSMEQASSCDTSEAEENENNAEVVKSTWDDSEEDEEDEEEFEVYFDQLLGRSRISMDDTPTSTSFTGNTITTTSYSSWCRPPPPPPTPTISLAPTTASSATTNLIASMLAETSAHGTTAADVLATAVAAAVAASMGITTDTNAMDTGDIDNHEVKAEQEEEEEKEEEKEEEAMAGLDNVSMVATRTEQDISSKLAKTTDEDSKLSTSTSTSVVTNEANNTLITSFASTTCNAEDDENEKIIADKKATTTSSDTTTTTLRQIQPRPIRSILSSLPNSPSFRPLSSITVSSKQSTTSLLHLNSQQRPLQSSALQRTTDELRKRRTVEVNSTFAKQTADIKRPRLFKAKPPVLVPVIPRNITTTRNSQSRNNKDMPMITRSVTLPILKKEHQSDHDASIPSDTSDDGLLITTMLTDPAMMNSVHTKSWSTPASVYTGSSATSSKAESLASTESNPDKEASCIKSNATADTSGDLLSIDELLDISQLYGRHSSLEPNGDNNSNNDDDDDDDDDKNGLCASFIDFNEGEDASDKEHLNDLARWKRVPIGVFRRTRHRRNSLPETMCASAVKWHHAGNYTLTSGRVDLRNGEHHNSISTTTTSTTTSTTTFAQSSALLTPAPTPLWNSPNTQFGASFHKHSVSMFSAAPTTTMTLVDKVEHDENTGLRLTIPPNNYESTGQPLFFGSNSGSNDHRYQEGESRMMSDAIYTSEQLATSSILWSTNDLPSADLANAFDTNDLLLLGLQPLKPSP